MIILLEFCKCGSLIIDSQCSNKKCPHRVVTEKTAKVVQKKTTSASRSTTTSSKATTPKKPNPRRNSKVITYNLYDLKEKEKQTPQ